MRYSQEGGFKEEVSQQIGAGAPSITAWMENVGNFLMTEDEECEERERPWERWEQREGVGIIWGILHPLFSFFY